MTASLKSATDDENAAKQAYSGLMGAKTKEVSTLTAQIETEMSRIGELSVGVATMQNDLEDTQESLAADTKFLQELEAGCDKKTAEWEEIKKTRAAELLALSETIKVLNDDDSLELFKKVLPGAASFVQVEVQTSQMQARALSMVRAIASAHRHSSSLPGRPQLDLIALALNGKQKGFSKVIKMIDGMVDVLKKEQNADSDK